MKWLFLLCISSLFGSYVGNPADPAIMNSGFFSASYPFFKFTSGYVYDYTSNKRYVASDELIKQFGLHSQMANLSLIFIERLQLFGRLGGSKEILKEKSIADLIFEPHTSYHFSWATGAKVILLQWGQTYFSTDFTYFAIPESSDSFLKYLDRFNLPISLGHTEKQELSLNEWQISGALSSRFFFLTPYGGIDYLRSRLNADVVYHNQVRWGFFYGLTLSLTGKFHLNFERRVTNEFAYTFSTIAVF